MKSSTQFQPGDRIISLSPNMLYRGRRGTIIEELDKVNSGGRVIWWKIQMDIKPDSLVTMPESMIRHIPLIDRLAELADD